MSRIKMHVNCIYVGVEGYVKNGFTLFRNYE